MRIGNRTFDTANHTYVMGILNVTPDSFSDGGSYNQLDLALKHVEEMMEQGVFRKGDPRAAAINFYAPIFFLLTKYSGQKEKTKEALLLLDKQIEEFFRLYHVG